VASWHTRLWAWCILEIPYRTEILWGEFRNGGDGRFLRVDPNVCAINLGTSCELALGEVRLSRKCWLAGDVIVKVVILSHSICVVRITCVRLYELTWVMNNWVLYCFLCIFCKLGWRLLDELIHVQRCLGRWRIVI
jgi:hypothetical protein